MSVSTSIRQASPAEMAAEIDRRGAVIEELEARLAAQPSRSGYPSLAIDQLCNHQTQLDMDGVMVGVSRQAIDEVLTFIAATLSALTPPLTVAGWQDIASAPKDAEIILAGRYARSGHWDIQTGRWQLPFSRWPYVGEEYPTHWQPLPTPPASQTP